MYRARIPIYDPDNYKMSQLDTSYGLTAQLNLQGSVSIGRSYNLNGHLGTFQFGDKVRN